MCCALATDKQTPAAVRNLVKHDQPNHKGNSCKQLKNKQEQDNKQLDSQRWGSESSSMGGLVDTRIYKEVAEAKLTTKQNPICLWRLGRYMRGGEDDQDVVGVVLQP